MNNSENQNSFKATNLLIVINVAVMLVMIVYNLANYGSLYLTEKTLTAFGGIIPNQSSLFTIIGAMFVHAGVFHIVINMLSLKFFGDEMEPVLGGFYLPIYLLSGIFAGMAIYFLGHNLTVGASGAICGIWGAKIVHVFRYNFPKSEKVKIVLDTLFLIGMGFLPFISGMGHAVGLASGALLSWVFFILSDKTNVETSNAVEEEKLIIVEQVYRARKH